MDESFPIPERLAQAMQNLDEATQKGLRISDYFPEVEDAYDADGIEIQVTVMRPTRVPDQPVYEAALWRGVSDTAQHIHQMINGA